MLSGDDPIPLMALCAKCRGLMNRDYRCSGCDASIHWFCSEGDVDENETKGHGAHYWCKACYSNERTDSSGVTISAGPTSAGGVTNAGLAPCAKCRGLMNRDYRCSGCDASIHWFCSEGDADENETKGHGAHYWCKACYSNKRTASSSIQYSESQGAPADAVDLFAFHSEQCIDLDERPTLEEVPVIRLLAEKRMLSKGRNGKGSTIKTSAARKNVKAKNSGAVMVEAKKADSSSKRGRKASQPVRAFSDDDGTPSVGSDSVEGSRGKAARIVNAPAKRKAITKTQQERKRNKENKNSSSLMVSEADPFINQLVGFSCNSDVGKMLIASFDTKWRVEAICKTIDSMHGHIVGVVMRKSKGKLNNSKATTAYDIAWEHTSLGETSVSSAYLLNGCMVGSRILKLRQQKSSNGRTDGIVESPASKSTTSTSTVTDGKKRRRRVARKRCEHMRSVLSTVPEEDGLMEAPKSESDQSDSSDAEKFDDKVSDWVIFGPSQAGLGHNNDVEDDSEEAAEASDPLVSSLDGLLWEHGVEMLDEPRDKMNPAPARILDEYKHLFTTPIDSMFAVLPYTFWELMAYEINRYATQCLDKSTKKLIVGYKWSPVSVREVLVFFAILIYYMMFPQTGRRMRDAWLDQERNPWTAHMSNSRFLQIRSTLHFNDNDDINGNRNDSLFKVRPLLNIVSKTIGKYATHGSEVSFDEATMACYSRFARHLLSFNPMKPTGKFHFKIYMLCCAMTNLTLGFRIHAREGPDNEPIDDGEEINKTDKLTMSICKQLYNSGTTVNMDNYYMSTTCAAHLRSKKVYCRGTIRSSRKFVPRSTLFTSAESWSLPRGTSRMAVNTEHQMVAVGWLDNKAVNFVSTSDTTAISSVLRRVGSDKREVPAPVVVCNYNKYMGGVDRHDRLRSTFSLGKRHKFRKYYVKLLLFLVDIALTNGWIYYQMANEKVGEKYGDRADFYIELARELLRNDVDFEGRYKVNANAARHTLRTQRENVDAGSDKEKSDSNSMSDDIDELIMPRNTHLTDEERAGVERFLRLATNETCTPCSFMAFPFPLKKRSKSCQICQYELKKPKWKDVVICPRHGVRLCLTVQPPRQSMLPALIKRDGSDVTDYSWTCEETASCWDKFHSFYSQHGLFNSKNLDLNQKRIKFGAVQYTSDLYQKKYAALGITIKKKGRNSKGVGLIVAAKHWKN